MNLVHWLGSCSTAQPRRGVQVPSFGFNQFTLHYLTCTYNYVYIYIWNMFILYIEGEKETDVEHRNILLVLPSPRLESWTCIQRNCLDGPWCSKPRTRRERSSGHHLSYQPWRTIACRYVRKPMFEIMILMYNASNGPWFLMFPLCFETCNRL